LKHFFGSGFALLILIAVPLDFSVAWRGANAQQNSASPATISTNPEAAQAERDWDSALAGALAAAHNLSDAKQDGSGPTTVKDLQQKYENAVKAANDAWDRFQSCLPQAQRCLLSTPATTGTPQISGTPPSSSGTSSTDNANPSKKSSDSNAQRLTTGSPPGSSVSCTCESLRWAAEWADRDAQTAENIDVDFAKRNGHRDPDLAAHTATAEDAARAAWARYRACLKSPPCPPPAANRESPNDLFTIFALTLGGLGLYEYPLPPITDPPPARLFDAPLPSQDLNPETGNHREAPGHFALDEFGNLTFQCDHDGCSATELPLQLTPNSATEPSKQPEVKPSNSAPPHTGLQRASIEYQIIGDWRSHGAIKYRVLPVNGRSFGTIPLVYERDVQANDSTYKYGIFLPSGQTYGIALHGPAPPGPRALAAAALNGLDWSMSRRRLSIADGFSRLDAGSATSVPGILILNGLTGGAATNVAAHGEVVGPSQLVVVGEDRAGTSSRTSNPSTFVLAAYTVSRDSIMPPPMLADFSSGTIYSIVSNGKSSGQALELQAYDPAARLKRVIVQPGTVLEPVELNSAKPVADPLPRNAALVKQQLTAYCLEFSKLPPEQGMFYRIAAQPVQEKFQSTRSVLRAAHKLGVDDDTTQYAVWSAVGNWDEQQFAVRFVEHSKKNAEAMNVNWTPQFESAVRAIVPERWRAVSLVLQEAANP